MFETMRRLAPVGRLDWLRASVGALAALLVTGLVSHWWLGPSANIPVLIAPIGASAVLLFAVPASPLAQPWSIMGGNMLSALAGIACAMAIPDPIYAAPMAAGLAIATMSLCRCLHPPGGAVALTTVVGGPAVVAAGWSFAIMPVALNSAILLGMALLFNNATRHSYPHRPPKLPVNNHGTQDPPPQDRVGYTPADIDAVLARYDELLDVSRDDLDALFRQVEAQAHRRLHRELRCEDIMSRDVIVTWPDEGVGQARDRLLTHKLAAMPVVDTDRRVIGIVSHAELLAGAGRTIADAMNPSPYRATPDAPIDQLLPMLSSGLHHHAVIANEKGRLAGMITQTDLLAALWRSHVAEQVASAAPVDQPVAARRLELVDQAP